MKIFKYALVFFLVFCNIKAQFTLVKNFGVKAGYITSNLEWEGEDLDLQKRNGFMLGIYGEFFDFQGLSLLIQMEYEQKGMQTEVMFLNYPKAGENTTLITDVRLDYFSIPLMLKYTPPIEFDIIPYIFGGANINLLMSQISTLDWFRTTYDSLSSNTIGLIGGIGFIFGPKDNVSLMAEFRYNFDLTDSDKSDFRKIKNKSFEIVLGFAFNSIIGI
ncbi:MAG: outer membrane beta-barrel protein [Ignavibacteriales bacterium]|nr:outer membrane beta-barrel protein [Ignavibacteriales bacterium]